MGPPLTWLDTDYSYFFDPGTEFSQEAWQEWPHYPYLYDMTVDRAYKACAWNVQRVAPDGDKFELGPFSRQGMLLVSPCVQITLTDCSLISTSPFHLSSLQRSRTTSMSADIYGLLPSCTVLSIRLRNGVLCVEQAYPHQRMVSSQTPNCARESNTPQKRYCSIRPCID